MEINSPVMFAQIRRCSKIKVTKLREPTRRALRLFAWYVPASDKCCLICTQLSIFSVSGIAWHPHAARFGNSPTNTNYSRWCSRKRTEGIYVGKFFGASGNVNLKKHTRLTSYACVPPSTLERSHTCMSSLETLVSHWCHMLSHTLCLPDTGWSLHQLTHHARVTSFSQQGNKMPPWPSAQIAEGRNGSL